MPNDPIATAFSRKAAVYDAFGVGHEQLMRMREAVYAELAAVVPAGGHLLELNAGTGLDAVEMVARGYRVHATDLAEGMVAEIEHKIGAGMGSGRLTAQQCSFNMLDQVEGPFDALYSNSGGLNCTAELAAVFGQFPRLLRRGGTVTLVIMPPFCPWEHALWWKDWRVATRRWRPGGVLAHVEGAHFMTYYFTPRHVLAALGPAFHLVSLRSLALLTPTADNDQFARRRPRLYRALVALETPLLGRWPFNQWGDFFMLTARFNGQ